MITSASASSVGEEIVLKRRIFDELFQYDDSVGSIDTCAFKASVSEIVSEVVYEIA